MFKDLYVANISLLLKQAPKGLRLQHTKDDFVLF